MDPAKSMRSVTFVIDGLGYTSHARQVSLLAPAMKSTGCSVRVISLAKSGAFEAALRSSGVLVEVVGTGKVLDPGKYLALRRFTKEQSAGILHVFGLSALRALKVSGIGLKRPSIVLTLNGRERFNPFDRSIANSCSAITVPHSAAADALRGQGVVARFEVVPPAVAEFPGIANRDETCRELGLPVDAPIAITAGRLERRADYFPTLWLFSYVHYIQTGAHLLIIGDGPARSELVHAAKGLSPEGTSIRFAGARPDVPSLMGLAQLAIVMNPRGGMNAALEAMSAGLPVVATDTTDLRSIVEHGKFGYLIPNNQLLNASRAVRNLLLNRNERMQMGDAARQHVREQHNIARVRTMYEALYEL